MPYPNEHACRLREPGSFQPNSFRRMARDHEGKKYSIIMGKLKGEDTLTEQAYRYDKEAWDADTARAHCGAHDGTFEVAAQMSAAEVEVPQASLEEAEQFAHTFNTAAAAGKSKLEAWQEALDQLGVTFNVERDGKLFEAGSYPDKEIEVTEDDLDTIIAHHKDAPPIEVKLEHADTLLNGMLATAGGLYRKGKELFGKLNFTDAAWELLKNTKKSLSCAIRKDKTGISEVSLVREPRIADARAFGSDVVGFSTPFDEGDITNPVTKEVANMADKPDEMTVAEHFANSKNLDAIVDKARQLIEHSKATDEKLKRVTEDLANMTTAFQKDTTERLIDQYTRSGHIKPPAIPFARAIFAKQSVPGSVLPNEALVPFMQTKDGEESEVALSFAQVFEKFLEANGKVILIPELIDARNRKESSFSDGEFNAALNLDPTMTRERMAKANANAKQEGVS